MKTRNLLVLLSAVTVCSANAASAGWWSGNGHYLGQHHDASFNNRFLQRPCPPYHGWNRPFYGWSSNYRPYYYTPQTYANTPWDYGPHYRETVYRNAAPSPGLNSYGVPVQPTGAVPDNPTLAPMVHGAPAVPQAAPTLAPPMQTPAIPQPPQPELK